MHLYTDISGQGAPLVLIHGLFGSYENLGMIARQLADNFQIINVDLRNHGKSGHLSTMTYPQMAEDVLETLDKLDIRSANFLGHSMGGKVAMQIALTAPERVLKLVLADISPVVTAPRHQTILEALAALPIAELSDRREADPLLSNAVPELAVRQFLLKNLLKVDGQLQWRFNLTALMANYPDILSAPIGNGPYIGPVLFVKGGDSDYIQASHQPIIQALFPNAKAKIIQGTGHWLHAEKPAAFAKIVRDFLLS